MASRVKTVVSGTEFNVAAKYRIIKPIGSGAYGIVVSAEDVSTGKRVAIKKVGNAFHDLIDAKRILREIKLMRFFGEHENLVTLYDMEEPSSPTGFEDIYIITELMETDLHRIIYSKQKLTDDHHAYFIYQLLRGLKYMHSANVIHRDLKPSNILLNSNCDLRICDLGLARGISQEGSGPLTEYVVTRWYRAPEIMLACREYTKAVDIWAVGCILAELLRRKPLFAGSDYMDQLRLITSVLGSPSDEDMAFVKSERAKAFMAKQAGKPKQPWKAVCKRANPLALDLLDRMLQFNPAKRITVEEALAHPYLATLHCPEDEPNHISKFDFSFEYGIKLDKPNLQRLMYEEIIALKRAKAPKPTVAPALMPGEISTGTDSKWASPTGGAPTGQARPTANGDMAGNATVQGGSGAVRAQATSEPTGEAGSVTTAGDHARTASGSSVQRLPSIPRPPSNRIPIGPEHLHGRAPSGLDNDHARTGSASGAAPNGSRPGGGEDPLPPIPARTRAI